MGCKKHRSLKGKGNAQNDRKGFWMAAIMGCMSKVSRLQLNESFQEKCLNYQMGLFFKNSVN